MSHTGSVYGEKVVLELQAKIKKLERNTEVDQDLIHALNKKIKKLNDQIKQSAEILREANCEILGDCQKGLTRANLKAKNKELEEKIENLEAINKMTKDSIKECKEGCDGGVYGLVPQELYTKAVEENKKLKEGTLLKFQEVEIEDLKEEIEGWKKVYVDYAAGNAKDLTFENFGEYLDAEPRWLEEDIEKQEKEIEELEGEVEKLKEKVEDLEAEGNLANEQVERLTEVEKKLLAELADSAPLAAVEALKFMGYKYNNGSWEEEEEEDVEYNSHGEPLEKDKYDGDVWALGCGFTTKDGEYRMNMCGGCAEWFDYVINKNGCFIHDKDGMEKVRTFVSCPEGNYVKVLRFGELDYKLAEGETDMFEMVKECFTEEIMEYEEEEWENPNETEDGENHGFE